MEKSLKIPLEKVVLDAMEDAAKRLLVRGVAIFCMAWLGEKEIVFHPIVIGTMAEGKKNYFAFASAQLAQALRTGLPSGTTKFPFEGEPPTLGCVIYTEEHMSAFFSFHGSCPDILGKQIAGAGLQAFKTWHVQQAEEE